MTALNVFGYLAVAAIWLFGKHGAAPVFDGFVGGVCVTLALVHVAFGVRHRGGRWWQ